MKKFKTIISVLLAAVIIACAFTACKGNKSKTQEGQTVTVSVNSETSASGSANGGKNAQNGESNTSAAGTNGAAGASASASNSQSANGSAASNASANKAGGSNSSGKGQNNNSKKKANTIKKPSAPAKPSGLKVSNVKTTSLTLSWKGVKCTAYEVRYKKSGDAQWNTAKDKTTAVKLDFKDLESYTSYDFAVRAYNENDAGRSASDFAIISKKMTKADTKTKRKIKITVELPFDSNVKDTLTLYIKQDGDKKETAIKTDTINCNGKTYTFETEQEYKGVVQIRGELKDHKTSDSKKTDKGSCTIDLRAIGIDNEYDDLD